jgi:ATP synthase protein I
LQKLKPAVDSKNQDELLDFKPLTPEEARLFRLQHPQSSAWRVVKWQAIAVVVLTLSALCLSLVSSLAISVAWSVGYGALTVVVPAAMFARGMTGKLASINPLSAFAGFFVWEMVKLALTVAMLSAAPRVVTDLSWPGMLVGLVLTLQVYWMVSAFGSKPRS